MEEIRIDKLIHCCYALPLAYTCRVKGSPNWTAFNAAQSEEKTRFVTLLADLCNTVPQPPRPPGAGRLRLPLADMVFTPHIRCTFTHSLLSVSRLCFLLNHLT
jgi:hypothetical protein